MLMLSLSVMVAASFANVPGGGTTGADVTVTDNGTTVVLDNGIVSITVPKQRGPLRTVMCARERTFFPRCYARPGKNRSLRHNHPANGPAWLWVTVMERSHHPAATTGSAVVRYVTSARSFLRPAYIRQKKRQPHRQRQHQHFSAIHSSSWLIFSIMRNTFIHLTYH